MKVHDTTPKANFLRALQSQSWTIGGAISEFVDNSFGPGRGNADRVTLTIDQKARALWVLDDGAGMDHLGLLFQLGATIGRVVGDIGHYGSGGTMALLWLADRVDVWVMRDGLVTHDSVNWKDTITDNAYPIVSGEWTAATPANTPRDLYDVGHGTLIHLAIQRERAMTRGTADQVCRDLEQTYAPALRAGKQLIWRTIGRNGGERVLSDPTPTLKNPTAIRGEVPLYDGVRLTFSGLVGVIDDLPHSKSTIQIGYGVRVISRTRDCFCSPDNEDEKYAGTGVCGFVDLGEGWQSYLSTTKNGINNGEAWRGLMASVFRQIRPILQSRDEQRMTMLFQDLALSFKTLFTANTALEVTIRKPIIPDIPGGDGEGQPHDDDAPARVRRLDERADGRDAKLPAISGLVIQQLNDVAMDRCLCKIVREGAGLLALVNGEHPDVVEAMKARPVNFRALVFLITSQIAELVARDDRLRAQLFAPRVCEEIERCSEGRSGRIMRLLVDRVTQPKAAA